MNWLLVACGGAIGASLRYGAGLVITRPLSGFPWTTWIVNLFGCFLAGIFFALSQRYTVLQGESRLFFMVGILGGFTTFSSFGLETFQLIRHGQLALAVAYSASSILLGIVSLAIGFYLLQALFSFK